MGPLLTLFSNPLSTPLLNRPLNFFIVISASLILYRAIHVVIVSQNYFVLFSWGITQLSRDMLQDGVSHSCACEKVSPIGGAGVSHHSGGALASLKRYRAIWGIAAVVSVRAQRLKKVNLARNFQSRLKNVHKEGKSAIIWPINLSNLWKFCQIWPRVIYLC